MLIEPSRNLVVAGERLHLDPEDVIEFRTLKRGRDVHRIKY
jgi:hypothetical protein